MSITHAEQEINAVAAWFVVRDLLGMAYKFVNSHKQRRSPSRNRHNPV